MNLRSRIWGIGAGVFGIVNLLGALLAQRMGERVHTDVHLVLFLVSALVYVAWRAVTRGRRGEPQLSAAAVDPQISYLQQSIDALALEVERLGEAQRARERSRSEQVPPPNPPSTKDQR